MPEKPARHYRYYDLIMAAYVCILLCANLIGPSKVAAVDVPVVRQGDLRGRRVVLSAVLHIRRHTHRGVRLRARPALRMGRLCRTRVCGIYGISHRGLAAGGGMAGQAGPCAGRIWQHLAHYRCLDHRLLERLLRQQLRARQDEDLDARVAGCGREPSARPYAAKRSIRGCFTRWPSTASGINRCCSRSWPRNTCSRPAWEVVNTPLTYRVVAFLKRAEHEDYYDSDTNFTPFSLQT